MLIQQCEFFLILDYLWQPVIREYSSILLFTPLNIILDIT